MPPKLVSSYAESIAPVRTRPMPSEDMRESSLGAHNDLFEPAAGLWPWVRDTFLEEKAPLFNAEHVHLRQASVGLLWTNVLNGRHMRAIIGQAEMPMAKGGKWAKARHDLQLRDWFGSVPDFVITLSAPYAATADDASFCALIEHEMLHCAQARTAYGVPRFSRSTGRPIFAMRGHDVEEFTSIVRRYGAKAAGVEDLVAAAAAKPLIAGAAIAGACGTCMARAA